MANDHEMVKAAVTMEVTELLILAPKKSPIPEHYNHLSSELPTREIAALEVRYSYNFCAIRSCTNGYNRRHTFVQWRLNKTY